MIVSCESCKSRYKLDDSKITGRGAKITCPKCKHVFVVLAPPPTTTDSPRPAMLPEAGDTNEWEDDEPTRVGREAAEAAAAAEAGPAVAREHQVVRARAGTPAAAPPPTKEAVAALAAKLDFRKVGITAWKVKVRIGLVYDFSDIKTLRKYIQDGRVTAADVISHDGKNWKPLGDIPDLDSFFVESYERLEVEYAAKAPASKESGPSPADLGNVAAALAAAAAEVDERGESRATGPVYEDPFEAMKQRQRERGTKKPHPKAVKTPADHTRMLAAAAVLVAVAGAGLWWTFGRTPPPPAPLVATGAPAPKEPTPRGAADDRWKTLPPDAAGTIEAATPTAPLPGDCPDGYVWNIKRQACMMAGPRGAGPIEQIPRPGTPKAIPTAPIGGASSISDSDDEGIGDEAMKKKDFETAVVAYGKARVPLKLGEAQMRAGDQAGAMATLTRASASNKQAFKFIGELLETAGDLPGARDAFQKYVEAFPKDAAAKAHLESLAP
ncbi:MAG: hypothetical protein EXR71_07925 [Myxococcales bacterium]|nr:hypothetical protein [Myxococcales bacterium]